jgi:hypothetical protein
LRVVGCNSGQELDVEEVLCCFLCALPVQLQLLGMEPSARSATVWRSWSCRAHL